MSTKLEILGQKIKEIYYSPIYAKHNYGSIFIDLENNTRILFNYYGVSYNDVCKEYDDLYVINVPQQIVELYKGKEIIAITEYDQFWHNDHSIIKLENDIEIYGETYSTDVITIGTYEWKSDELSTEINKKAPPIFAEQRKYEDIVEYFQNYTFGSNMQVLSHLSLIKPYDRIQIINRVMDYGTHNLYTYDKLSMAYVKDGKLLYGINTLNLGSINGTIDQDNFEMMKEKISGMSKTVPFDKITQLNYFKEKKENSSQQELIFLDLLEDFVIKNYD